MKNEKQINNRTSYNKSKKRRTQYFGWTLLTSALLISGFSYLSQLDYISSNINITAEEVENYYMMSFVFGVMGMFCLS